MKRYVLDTSALLTYLSDEAGAQTVEDLLIDALNATCDIFVSVLTLVEIAYILKRKKQFDVSMQLDNIQQLPIEVVDFNVRLVRQSAAFKATGKMSFADACIAALAKQKQATLVHKDPEYEMIKSEVTQLVLPYKTKTSVISND